jgi:hypothetical protein
MLDGVTYPNIHNPTQYSIREWALWPWADPGARLLRDSVLGIPVHNTFFLT